MYYGNDMDEAARYSAKGAAWDKLLELGVTEQTLQIVACINGYSLDTMEAVLFAFTGERSFDQLDDEEG